MKTFHLFSEWEQACQNLGLEGPFRLSGSPAHSWQFIQKKGGTAALWNGEHGSGYVFSDSATEPQEAGR